MVHKAIEWIKRWRVKRVTKPYGISTKELEVLVKYGSNYDSIITLIDSAGEKMSRNYFSHNDELSFEEEQIVFALERKWCF